MTTRFIHHSLQSIDLVFSQEATFDNCNFILVLQLLWNGGGGNPHLFVNNAVASGAIMYSSRNSRVIFCPLLIFSMPLVSNRLEMFSPCIWVMRLDINCWHAFSKDIMKEKLVMFSGSCRTVSSATAPGSYRQLARTTWSCRTGPEVTVVARYAMVWWALHVYHCEDAVTWIFRHEFDLKSAAVTSNAATKIAVTNI